MFVQRAASLRCALEHVGVCVNWGRGGRLPAPGASGGRRAGGCSVPQPPAPQGHLLAVETWCYTTLFCQQCHSIVPGLIHGGSELATSWPFRSGCPPGELQQLARAALRV